MFSKGVVLNTMCKNQIGNDYRNIKFVDLPLQFQQKLIGTYTNMN